MRRLATFLSVACLTASIGCEANSPSKTVPPITPVSTGSTPTGMPAESTTAAESKTDDVTLNIKSWDDTLTLVAEHKGKVVVLDLWSTSCQPCLDEFPHLVELHKKYGSDKLVCVSVSCDFVGIQGKPPESYKDQVLEFLTRQKATFPNVLLNVESDALFEKLELASNPAVFVFGKDGKLAKRFDNDNAKNGEEFTYQKDVLPFVEKAMSGD